VHQDCWVVTGAGDEDWSVEDDWSVEPSSYVEVLSDEEEDDEEDEEVLATVAVLPSAGSWPEAICT
jgi:hypothetical protein